jgi:hypothetical protein
MIRRLFIAGVLALSITVPVAARADGGGSCGLGSNYHVTSVEPYRTSEGAGYIADPRLRGAEVTVEAQPGLTREWLLHTLETEIAQGVCSFGPAKVAVSVTSAGGGFSVLLTGSDERAGREILEHAQQLTK